MESGTTEATVDPTSTVGRERSSKKTVKVTGSFVHSKSEEASNRRYVAKLQAFLNSYYLANFMAAVVMIDAYCTCVDIDATAAGGAPPQVFAVISDACLVTYTLEVVALLTTFGFRELVNDWMMMLDVVIVGCGCWEAVEHAVVCFGGTWAGIGIGLNQGSNLKRASTTNHQNAKPRKPQNLK